MSPMPCEGTPVLSYGTYIQVQDPADHEWLYLAGLTGFNGPQITRGEIDATRLCSTSKEYLLDLKDNGAFSADVQTMLGTRSQQLMIAGLSSNDKYLFRLVIPDDGLGNGPVAMTFDGRVQSFPITASSGQIITSALSLRITGDVVFDYPAALGVSLQYSGFILNESAGNDGAVSGVISVVLSGDTFAGADGDEITSVTFTGVPAGLTPHVQKINGTTAVINFSGNATNHAEEDSSQLTMSFLDAAFTTGPANAISGATDRQFTINFVS